MFTEVLVFSVVVVLVFAGAVAAIVKFTLTGNTESTLSNRINTSKYNEAMAQSGLAVEKEVEKEQNRTLNQNIKPAHSMA